MSRSRFYSTSLLALLTLSVLLPIEVANAQDPNWASDFYPRGTAGDVRCVQAYGDGYVVGGDFRWLGSTRVGGLAYFDGTQWLDLTDGTEVVVWSLAVHDGDLIISGTFESIAGVAAHNVARWDGTQWYAMGDGLERFVLSITSFQNDLYCGAYRWDGASWENVFQTDGRVEDMIEWQGKLVVCGSFSGASGASADRFFVWDGDQIDTSIPHPAVDVTRLEIFRGDLVVMAYQGVDAYPVRLWTGSEWRTPGEGSPFSGTSQVIVTYEDHLFLVYEYGYEWFCERWDGSSWEAGFPAGDIRMAEVVGEQLVLAGSFASLGEVGVFHIAIGDGVDFDSVVEGGQGLAGTGRSWTRRCEMTPGPGGICAYRNFGSAGPVASREVAVWSGEQWSSRDLPRDKDVFCMVWTEDGLVGGGWDSPYRVEKTGSDPCFLSWTGSGWNSINTFNIWGYLQFLIPQRDPQTGEIVPHVLYGSDGYLIYTVLSPWGVGNELFNVSGYVEVLGHWSGHLVAGGSFSQIQAGSETPVPVRGLGVYEDGTWHEIGGGVAGSAYAVAEWYGGLIVGGYLSEAGDTPINNIAYWNGTSWDALGGGVTGGAVQTIAVSDNYIFVGGIFDNAGGMPAANIAYYDGTEWHALGSGTNGPVADLIVADDRLYVSGAFTEAGGYAANLFTYWQDLTVGVEVLEFAATRDGSAVDLSWRLRHDPGQDLLIRRTAVTGSVTVAEIAAGSGPSGNLRDDDAPAGVLTYDLVEIDAGGAQQVITTAQVAATSLPVASLRIETVRPNPLNPQTTVTFTLGRTQHVRATVLDVAGRKVADLADGVMTAGRRTLTWNGQNATGHPASSGTYLIRIAAEDKVETAKVAVVR